MFILNTIINYIALIFLFAASLSSFASERSDRQNYALFLKETLVAKPQEQLDSLKKFKLTNYYKLSQQRVLGDNKLKHLQVSLKLFNKQKYSLLLKSMISFEKVYGREASMGWHEYFHIHILESKIKNKKEISKQVLSIVKNFLEKYKVHSDSDHVSDYNLLFSFYRVSMKYLLLDQNDKQFKAYLTIYQKLAKKINSKREQLWAHKVIAEFQLEKNLKIEDRTLNNLSYVNKADFKIYQSLNLSFELNDVNILNTKENRDYLSEKWDDYTPSLVSNLVYLGILLEDERSIRLYYSKFNEMTLGIESFVDKKLVYDLLINDEDLDSSSYREITPSVRLVYKIKNLGLNSLLTSSQRALLSHELEVILYTKRIKQIQGYISIFSFISYVEHIPMFKFNNELKQKLLDVFEDKLFQIYKANPKIAIKSWNQLSLKSNIVSMLKNKNQVILGQIFALNFSQYKDQYFSILNKIEERELHQIETYRQFISKNWKRVVSMTKDEELIEGQIFKTISLGELGLYKSSRIASDQILTSSQKIPEQWKQDFFLNYIRVLKSTLSKVEYFKRLKKIKQSISVGSVEMPRVKEYAAFELIGLNMTLKQSSFEENLKNVNIFLNNYPRSKFYSMMVLTRATILAQLKRIKESTEAIQEVITKTTNKKIKIEALNELAILKLR